MTVDLAEPRKSGPSGAAYRRRTPGCQENRDCSLVPPFSTDAKTTRCGKGSRGGEKKKTAQPGTNPLIHATRADDQERPLPSHSACDILALGAGDDDDLPGKVDADEPK